jgi:tetratricopeptide (TPR) repeat protein
MYPSDLRLRFEYASRLFEAGKVDDAIPMFQTARSDPKNRDRCDLYMGRSFFAKGLYDQALEILVGAIQAKEVPDDELAKQLMYWRGRAEEATGRLAEAKTTYSQIVRQDYNYRDIRARLETLSKSG